MSSVEPLNPSETPAVLRLSPGPRPDSTPFVRFSLDPGETGRFRLPLQHLEGVAGEAWWTNGDPIADESSTSSARTIIAGDWLVLEDSVDESVAPREAARQLYTRLFQRLKASGYPHIVKCWNYLSRINEGDGDEERYKQFCIGRAEALDAEWAEDYWPAATGVGTDAGLGLRVMVLASRARPELIENPRQVSAFRYPRQFGPKSPNFSRAALIGDSGSRLLFLSGTAAIVGHDSRHAASVEAQVDETLKNWSSLFDAVAQGGEPRPSLTAEGWFRVYVRRPEDLGAVRARLEAAGLPLGRTLFLQADICRRELLFEMDGVIALPG